MLSNVLYAPSRPMAFDVVCHLTSSANLLQSITKTAHSALSSLFPLDSEGGYGWKNDEDPEAADAECERVFSIVEGAGLSLLLL